MEVSKTSSRVKIRTILFAIALLFLASISTLNQSRAQPSSAVSPPTQAPPATAVIALSPPNITDLSKTVGGQITFNVTLASSPVITAFGVWLQYNTSVLKPIDPPSSTIDYKGNILGANAQVSSECVGSSVIAKGCGISPSPDILDLALYNLGNQTSASPGGLLFRVTFNVIGTGFSRLHIYQYVLSNGLKAEAYGANPIDGFFTNKNCGASFCKPLRVDFTFSPLVPSTGATVIFNATSSADTNGGTITSYTWSWGEANPCRGVATTQMTPNATFPHVFCAAANYAVTLLVSDSFGVTWSVTKTVQIVYVFIDVTPEGPIVADPKFGVSPGTIIRISANIFNNSTLNVPANVTLTVEGTTPLVSWTKSFNLAASTGITGGRSSGTLTGLWNTTKDLPIQAYRIDAVITSSVPQNVTTDKHWATYIQFVQPQVGGVLSLSLLQSSGLSILVIAALVAGLARFRKKPSWETEPLTQE